MRWTEVTEEGFRGGPVMPDSYDGSPQTVEQLKQNIARSGIVGSLVATNFKSSMIFVPLLDREPGTGKRIDYHGLSQVLEEKIRAKYELAKAIDADRGGKAVAEHPDPRHRLRQADRRADRRPAQGDGVLRHRRRRSPPPSSTPTRAACAARRWWSPARSSRSIWQLGLVALFGFELDPFSILVPFLVFAIGVSHGAQKMNGIMQDIGRGTHKLVAARYTFRRLFLAGLTALLADAVGFAVLMVIDIPVIKELALTASIGVAVLIFTNLLLLPVLLSYTGVSAGGRAAQPARGQARKRAARASAGCGSCSTASRRAAGRSAPSACRRCSPIAGFVVEHASEDRRPRPRRARSCGADSRYNRDNAYITANYALSSDQFAVIVKTDKEGCLKYQTLIEADRLAWALKQVPGVQTTVSLADAARQITAGSFEGNPKWLTINRNQDVLNYAAQQASVNNPGPVQHRLLGDAGDRLPGRPQGRDPRPRRAGRRGLRRPAQRRGPPVPARRRQRRHRGRDEHRRRAREPHDAPLRVRGGDRCSASSRSAAGAPWSWRSCR